MAKKRAPDYIFLYILYAFSGTSGAIAAMCFLSFVISFIFLILY